MDYYDDDDHYCLDNIHSIDDALEKKSKKYFQSKEHPHSLVVGAAAEKMMGIRVKRDQSLHR
jgi:hypothetical protein